MSRSVVHVLLSLLLLVSQQMSVLHGFSHWNEFRQALSRHALLQEAEPSPDGKPSKPVLHEICAQCATGAQLAFALPAMAYLFTPLELAFSLLAAPCAQGIRLLTTCVFQPRGPPQAA